MTTTTKQTAANNADLARIKQAFNAPIYKEVLGIYNSEGRDAAKIYIGQFFNDEYRERRITGIFGE